MTALSSNTLRPGLLVSLKTSIRGNVDYDKRTIEQDSFTADGARVAKWETVRTIENPEEFESAKVARGKARSLIVSVCSQTSFGYLCPEIDSEKLSRAIADARNVAAEFNATATHSKLSVYVITGRVADNDLEAVRAINSEVRGLLESMQAGVRNLDASMIREAANKARNLGAMLSPDAQVRIQLAIDTARETARRIVKAGTTAAAEIDNSAIRRIEESRVAFLDIDSAPVVDVAAPAPETRAVDFAPAAPEVAPVANAESPAFDMDSAGAVAAPVAATVPQFDFAAE